MSEAESPIRKAPGHEVTVDDIRQLMGASTPHFALQIRNRIARLIPGLPEDHPARIEGEREIARLQSWASRRVPRPRPRGRLAPLPSLATRAPPGPDRGP